MVTPIFATLIFDYWLACLNLSGVTMGMDARTTMSSAPDEPKKPLGFSEPFFV
ncbi:hypothetical protein AAGU66_15370 [Edwardsiella ictaluri]|uniref:Uncharacterized protein n=1 Tax=Edwardsiella ictaluri (strain 93-146) TaxID=634503 RepID=C5BEX9_EDWI9|nr:hypothetical protein [Edwardsiella ictaluri]ACR70651.1 hypothetical protein NT01EI_3515 [Edwardsiella ictaluri 93-146]EKS7761747.1 hypothetical protein [Edwardsiella ictaluri]EKS7770001.1 hypothetical protein [Edwardsiella ictaluri]EKS7773054.1 hypothetical protein [Edwardsiella ictaluri]EKS7775165.1 hypothetical protein [Edwardsiella ictaluri]